MNKMNRSVIKYTILVALVVVVALAGCRSRTNGEFSAFTPLPENGWAYGDSVVILASGIDSIGEHRLAVGLCHSDEFLYRNLWLELSHRDPSGAMVRDTVNIPMADSHGRWLGKGMGANYQIEVVMPYPVELTDSTPISVRHIMRVDTLRGVSKIGVTVEDVK